MCIKLKYLQNVWMIRARKYTSLKGKNVGSSWERADCFLPDKKIKINKKSVPRADLQATLKINDKALKFSNSCFQQTLF